MGKNLKIQRMEIWKTENIIQFDDVIDENKK